MPMREDVQMCLYADMPMKREWLMSDVMMSDVTYMQAPA